MPYSSHNLCNKIPIFIHHEIGQKKQAGKDKQQFYLKYCISQAEKFGNEVLLFGDYSNKNWTKKFVNVNEISSKKWDEFVCCFENYSTYPDAWAKGIFKRFFLFREYVLTNNIQYFFVLDSDILLYTNLSELNFWNTIDFAGEIPLRQNLINDDGFRWTICAGVSYWTKNSICEFVDFCIYTYKDNKHLLLRKWNYHKKNNLPGGVCEMSLLYLWLNNSPNIRYLNLLNTGINDIQFNLNYMTSENYIDNEYQLFPCLGVKRIKFKNGLPYLVKKNNSEILIKNLHFVGNSKLLMHDIYKFQGIKPITYLYYIFWNVRGKLAIFLRKMGLKK